MIQPLPFSFLLQNDALILINFSCDKVSCKRKRFENLNPELDIENHNATNFPGRVQKKKERLPYLHTSEMHKKLPYYDPNGVLLSFTVDQVPLPIIPGLTTKKPSKIPKKCTMQEHVHKNVSFIMIVEHNVLHALLPNV